MGRCIMHKNRDSVKLFTQCVLHLLVFAVTNIHSCHGRILLPKNITIPGVFAFGDSVVDQGNNNFITTLVKADFLPYGKDFSGGIPTGRFCNGKTPPDFIAEELGIKETVPAYLDPKLNPQDLITGVSFASGGCGFDPQTSQIASAISLSTQLKYFKDYKQKLISIVGSEKATKIITESIHLVVVGSDDLANTYFLFGTRRYHYDIPSYADFVASHASTFIQGLYDLGARRIAVFGIPPVGCLPSQRTLAGGLTRQCNEKYNNAAQLVNSKLSLRVDSLTRTLTHSKMAYIDIYNPLMDIIRNPTNFGFEVSDRGCCGSGNIEVVILCNKFVGSCEDDSKYVFWDSYHPTERTYEIIVTQLLKRYVTKFL